MPEVQRSSSGSGNIPNGSGTLSFPSQEVRPSDSSGDTSEVAGGLRGEEGLRYELLRARWELRELRDKRDEAKADAARWRNCYENALHYLAVLQPNLAEIAEDDLFQIWKASL